MFDKVKSLMEMQKKMQEMKRQLENTVFDVQSSDGIIRLTMNGSQELKGVKITADLKALDCAALEQAVKDALAKAIKRSQEVAAEKMKEITGFNAPGLT